MCRAEDWRRAWYEIMDAGHVGPHRNSLLVHFTGSGCLANRKDQHGEGNWASPSPHGLNSRTVARSSTNSDTTLGTQGPSILEATSLGNPTSPTAQLGSGTSNLNTKDTAQDNTKVNSQAASFILQERQQVLGYQPLGLHTGQEVRNEPNMDLSEHGERGYRSLGTTLGTQLHGVCRDLGNAGR